MADAEEETVNGVPFLLKLSKFQGVYQNYEEVDEDSNLVVLKMQASVEFKDKFNSFVHQLLIDCIKNARASGRKMMIPDDVPELEET
jgi:hypothetical protein